MFARNFIKSRQALGAARANLSHPSVTASRVAATQAPAADTLPGWAGALRRQALGIVLLLGFALLLRDRIAELDWAGITQALTTVSPWQWGAAALASAASFAALARYDLIIHRLLGTGQPVGRATRAGWVSIAISQTVGFGLITGALVRWRMLPGLSLVDASRLTATVAATFLAGWAVLSALVLLALPLPGPWHGSWEVRALSLLALGLGGGLAALALWRPGIRLARWHLRLPSLPMMGRILWFAFLDTGFAALALWVLLPEGAGSMVALYPAFLLALGAGFISGSPAGVGPFEVTLLALMPQSDPAPLIAAMLAWRLVYHAGPTVVAMGALAIADRSHPERARSRLVPPAPELTPRLAQLMHDSDPAELGLLRQGEHSVLLCPDTSSGWMVGTTGQALIGLLDPFGQARVAPLLPELRAAARESGRIAAAYKLGGRSAALARRAGWKVVPVAMECLLDPRAFTLEIPARSGLRRKLRKATKAGLVCQHDDTPDLNALAAVAEEWKTARGGERGFSMGRFAPDYVAGQVVITGRIGQQVVGFASFHDNGREWGLDLMRTGAAAPDGTMQALIVAALSAAKAQGITRLSLAALPPRAEEVDGPAARIWSRAEKSASAAGLRQFKMGFAPRLSPRYLAAPSHPALVLAAAEIARAIHTPPELPAHWSDTGHRWAS